MSKTIHSKTSELSSRARTAFGAATGSGHSLLTAVVILSGLLSAIFFWQNSQRIFANVWPPAALILGLLVGLIPAEGAFFGWKRVRATKADMTTSQLSATTAGIVTAVASSIFSTFALFVMSFDTVPAEIRQYNDWLVFLALSIPVIMQVAIYAWYTTNERAVVENHERAKLSAMGFNAYIQMEQARLMAVIQGMQTALDAQLEQYGAATGGAEADRLLHDGSQTLLNMGKQPETAVSAATTPQPEAKPETPPTVVPPFHVHHEHDGRRQHVATFATFAETYAWMEQSLPDYAAGMLVASDSQGLALLESRYDWPDASPTSQPVPPDFLPPNGNGRL